MVANDIKYLIFLNILLKSIFTSLKKYFQTHLIAKFRNGRLLELLVNTDIIVTCICWDSTMSPARNPYSKVPGRWNRESSALNWESRALHPSLAPDRWVTSGRHICSVCQYVEREKSPGISRHSRSIMKQTWASNPPLVQVQNSPVSFATSSMGGCSLSLSAAWAFSSTVYIWA